MVDIMVIMKVIFISANQYVDGNPYDGEGPPYDGKDNDESPYDGNGSPYILG